MQTIKILNVDIDNISMNELLENLGKDGGIVVTPNVDHLMKLQRDPAFYKTYLLSDYRVCDSKILMYAAKFLGKNIIEKISGSDFFPAFYTYHQNNPHITIFLLGAAPGVAKQAQDIINKKVGRNMIVGAHSPSFGFENKPDECAEIIDLINKSGATVLAIGVGAPKQEKWLHKYRHQLPNIQVFLAIGATIDFEAGNIQRSPQWMSKFGIEWLHRLMSEPKRLWKRYLIDDLPFFWLLIKQKLGIYRSPFADLQKYYEYLPIGEILKRADLITHEQVQDILKEQRDHHQYRFGQIASEKGLLQQVTADFWAEKLPQIRQNQSYLPIGQYLKLAGFLDDIHIDLILQEQRETKRLFGEIAVNHNLVKSTTIDFLLQVIPSKKSLAAD
jgi:exopolysaccharide biosynthesis WecB/TagA/CpsF family protein